MACPNQADGLLSAKGSGEGRDFKTAEGAAQTAMDADLLAKKIAWEKANACPQGCGFIDVWTDLPVVTPPPPADGVPKPLKKFNFDLGYAVTLTETEGIHRTCYETEAKQKAGKAQREEEARKAREAAAKKAREAAEKKK